MEIVFKIVGAAIFFFFSIYGFEYLIYLIIRANGFNGTYTEWSEYVNHNLKATEKEP